MSAYINSSHHTNTPRHILRRCSVKASHRRQMNAGVFFFFFFEATEQIGVGALLWGSDGFLTPALSNEHGPEESSLGCTHCAAWHWQEALIVQKRSGPDASASSMRCIPTLEITLQMRLLKNTCKWNKKQALHAWLAALAPVLADTDISLKTDAGLRPRSKI